VSEEVEEGHEKGVQIRVSAAYLGSILADMGSQGADTRILGVSWAYPGAKGQIQYPHMCIPYVSNVSWTIHWDTLVSQMYLECIS